ncbi:hypothetical protein LAG90_08655 [Marinilongibacter aquaticus]|uniref:VgrG-related protein n=1 Tax=Marinilongibacter aquaticus TaxID=2975157 RepID=UPI0021BD7286|nr:hypothetical protein [Marinilongibacter aquaticus]UBM60704.1 hypothetical protein LAG90_08655 [Marinilongibacter aquaticus]
MTICLAFRTKAQQYPVDCRVFVTPPYSNRLYDYAESPIKLKVQLLLRDQSKSQLDVSLQIRLKTLGFVVGNPDGFIATQPITLYPGSMKVLSGAELEENFSLVNMESQGIDLAELASGMGLPPGPYEWEVRAFELFRDRQVSNTATFRMHITQNYPPVLNQPSDGAELTATSPQSVNFSWTPRQSGSLASQGLIYTLYIYEVPEGENPKAVVNSGQAPFRVIETAQPNYFYGPFEVPFDTGKTYAWQVQVSDLVGQDMYLNNGFSDISTFTFGKNNCQTPQNVQAFVGGDGAVSFEWEANEQAKSYVLRYRLSGETQFEEELLFENKFLLLYQSPGNTYEYTVLCNCENGTDSPEGRLAFFSIPEGDDSGYEQESGEAWVSQPDELYAAEEYVQDENFFQESGQEETSLDDLLNTPVTIYIPGEEGADVEPQSLPSDPTGLSTDELKEKLESMKPTCAGIAANYVCGVHDGVPQYGGPLVSVSSGDEVAMNSLVISIVDIDGSGNGRGMIKIPMLNNAKLGVSLTGIQVADGGCIVAGRAELNNVDIAFLNAEQRKKLEEAYALFVQATDAAYANAGAIAETINNLADFLQKARAFVHDYSGGKNEARKAKAYQEYARQVQAKLLESEAVPEDLKKKLSDAIAAAQPAWDFYQSGDPCEAGGSAGAGDFYFHLNLADCSTSAAQVERELAAIELAAESIKCNCLPLGDEVSHCDEIVSIMTGIKLANGLEKGERFYEMSKPAFGLPYYENGGVSNLTGVDKSGHCYHLRIEPHFAKGTDFLYLADYLVEENTIHIKTAEGKKGVSITLLGKSRASMDDLLVELGFEEGELQKEPEKEGEISTLKHPSDREYGWLSEAQESGGNSCIIGYDSKGGCSYGRHQLAVRTGKFEGYKKYVQGNYSSYYEKYAAIFTSEYIALAKSAGSKAECLSTPLTEAFNQVCSDDNFSNLAHNTITEQNYKPVYDRIMDQFAGTALFSNMSVRDEEALKEMCYSLGVQHGGAFKVFQLALLKDYTACEDAQILDPTDKNCPPDEDNFSSKPIHDQGQINLMEATANQIDIGTFIDRVYAARKMYVKRNKAPGWQNMVKKRYNSEPEILINELGY